MTRGSFSRGRFPESNRTHALGRRGQSDTALEWLAINLIMTFIVCIVVVGLVSVYTDRDVDAAQVEIGAMLTRLTYSDLLMQRDATTGRVYQGIVDVTKCTDKRLDDTFVERRGVVAGGTAVPPQLSAMITATPAADCTLKAVSCAAHREDFSVAVAKSGMKNGALVVTRQYPVTLTDGKTSCGGTLSITVARLST